MRFDAMRMLPWPELDQQLAFVTWATRALPWGELLAFDAPGSLVLILVEDAGISRELTGDVRGGAAEHRKRCGYLDLVWRHEGTWQRLDGRVVELASDVLERVRCEVAPMFDGSDEGAASICKRFGPRAERLMQLRLTEQQRALMARLQPLVDRCGTHLLDEVQRAHLTQHPELRSDAAELEPPMREALQSRELLLAEYLPLHRKELGKLWGAIHRLGALLGYRLH
jgi:DNA-binding MarR family transcriptional regulator